MSTLRKDRYVLELDIVEWCELLTAFSTTDKWYEQCIEQAKADESVHLPWFIEQRDKYAALAKNVMAQGHITRNEKWVALDADGVVQEPTTVADERDMIELECALRTQQEQTEEDA